jgi:hypothetical protein
MAQSIQDTSATDSSCSVVSTSGNTRVAWLFSQSVDLAVFGGTALLALALVLVGLLTGLVDHDTPEWTWVPAVLLVDVAHVYSTGVRIYLDPDELRRRPLLYTVIPVGALVGALLLVSFGEEVFWRGLAYLAVFHFVRQQYGWVALYRRKAGESDRVGKWIDAATIYGATLYPLAYWHSNLPRRFWWFLEDDFVSGLSTSVLAVLEPAYWTLLAIYTCRSVWSWLVLKRPNPGKDLVVATTAACWYLGIVAFNSDYVFTVTNVLIHGVPYMALVYFSGKRRSKADAPSSIGRLFSNGIVPFLLTLWALAYVEELLWHRFVWWDRGWLFGSPFDPGSVRPAVIAVLAVPQIVHYVLDGFIWRRGQARYL